MMYLSPQDRDYAIRTVLAEAGNQGVVGEAGVANVIKNRLASGKFGGNVSSIVTAPYQFEPWLYAGKGGKTNDPTRFDQSSKEYQDAGKIVDAVFSNSGAPDPTNGATHFINPNAQTALGRSIPTWAQGTPLATIGGHQYFAPQGAVKGSTAMDMTTMQPQSQQSQLMALLAPLMQAQQGGGAAGATGQSGLTRGYSPNLIGQILFGPQGARGAVQGGLNSMGMQNGILGSLFGGGQQQLPQNPAAQPGGMNGQAQPTPGGVPGMTPSPPPGAMPGGAPSPMASGPMPMGGNGMPMHAPLASMQMPSIGPQGTGGAGSTSPLSTITAGLNQLPNMSGLGALGSMFGML